MNLQAISGRLSATVRRVAFQIVGSGTESRGVVAGAAEHPVTVGTEQVSRLSGRVVVIDGERSQPLLSVQLLFRIAANLANTSLFRQHSSVVLSGDFVIPFHQGCAVDPQALFGVAISPFFARDNSTWGAMGRSPSSCRSLFPLQRKIFERFKMPAFRASLERFAGAPKRCLVRRIVSSHDVPFVSRVASGQNRAGACNTRPVRLSYAHPEKLVGWSA